MGSTRRSASAEPMLSPAEETRLIHAWKTSCDLPSRDRIVRAYARLCFSIASRYASNPDHVEDLAQEGAFGIMRALDRFDPVHGTRFSAYARPWVHNFVSAASSRVAVVVDVPPRTFIEARSGRLPGERGRIASAASSPTFSLDAPVRDGGVETEMDRMVSRAPSPEEECIASASRAHYRIFVDRAMEALSERERLVISRRALSEFPETLEVIARSLGLSRERVRQIEAAALMRIRSELERLGFDPVCLI